jgi:hypothetical protein
MRQLNRLRPLADPASFTIVHSFDFFPFAGPADEVLNIIIRKC